VLVDKPYTSCRETNDRNAALELAPAAALATEPEIRPTPLAALVFDDLPSELHFVRSHFGVPGLDSANWRLEVDGAVARGCCYSLPELRQRPVRTQTVVLECAGHRRREFRPSAPGLQWGVGALSEARWGGVALSDLLREVSLTDRACEVLFEGADRGPHRSSGSEVVFARSIPLERALAGDVLLAWEMNGEPIPAKHGAPLRVIVPGSYGVASVKWLRRISVLEQPFTGPFQVDDYQLNGKPLQDLRVNSLIVEPADRTVLPAGTTAVSGVAWGGRGGIAAVEVRLSDGPWQLAALSGPPRPTGLNRWSVALRLPPGEHCVEARARDCSDASQPERADWNPLGYANNSIHCIRVRGVDASRPSS
jgi:DMSO/TMAO reductase YedYZ molybdopterin-dependent catalytic subunit